MRVMQRAVIEYRDTKPLPSTMTDVAVKGATLPVKIEAARRAIAECVDLPELLRYRDQAEGLAAAVRTMKHVGPELIRNANEMMADAWRKGGELLSTYSSVAVGVRVPGGKGVVSNKASPRGEVCKSLGLTREESHQMVRVAAAPKPLVYKVVQKTASLSVTAGQLPATDAKRHSSAAHNAYSSSALRNIMANATTRAGLVNAFALLRRIPLDLFAQLAPDERKVVKAKICEIMELLDEMDRLCK